MVKGKKGGREHENTIKATGDRHRSSSSNHKRKKEGRTDKMKAEKNEEQ